MLLPLRRLAAWRRLLFWQHGNVTLNPGALGAVAATDDIGGVSFQLAKINLGALTANDGPVSKANPLPTRANGATGTLANVGANAAASVTVLAANANRLRAWLFNDSTSDVYVKYGVTASAMSFTKLLAPGEFHVIEGYTGIVDAIWVSLNGNMRTTELTA